MAIVFSEEMENEKAEVGTEKKSDDKNKQCAPEITPDGVYVVRKWQKENNDER